MKTKPTNPMTPQEVVNYLEEHGGTLRMSIGKTMWADGTITDHGWQYAAEDRQVTGAKTAIGAIQEHMKRRIKS